MQSDLGNVLVGVPSKPRDFFRTMPTDRCRESQGTQRRILPELGGRGSFVKGDPDPPPPSPSLPAVAIPSSCCQLAWPTIERVQLAANPATQYPAPAYGLLLNTERVRRIPVTPLAGLHMRRTPLIGRHATLRSEPYDRRDHREGGSGASSRGGSGHHRRTGGGGGGGGDGGEWRPHRDAHPGDQSCSRGNHGHSSRRSGREYSSPQSEAERALDKIYAPHHWRGVLSIRQYRGRPLRDQCPTRGQKGWLQPNYCCQCQIVLCHG